MPAAVGGAGGAEFGAHATTAAQPPRLRGAFPDDASTLPSSRLRAVRKSFEDGLQFSISALFAPLRFIVRFEQPQRNEGRGEDGAGFASSFGGRAQAASHEKRFGENVLLRERRATVRLLDEDSTRTHVGGC